MLSFPEIKEKDRLFAIYKGFIYCLDNLEALILLIDEKTTGLKSEAIIKKITYSAANSSDGQNTLLFRKAIVLMKDLKWPRCQRVAKVLFGISPYINKKEKAKLVMCFLNSKYNSFRYYGYSVIERGNLKLNYKKTFLNVWHRHHDIWALELLVDVLKPEELFSIYGEAEELLADSEFDFEILKLRNRFYSRIINFIPDRLSELLLNEPVSYVFVMKYARKQIQKDLALEIYQKSNNSGSILTCYGELGQWDILIEIYKFIKKNAKKSISSQEQENKLTS